MGTLMKKKLYKFFIVSGNKNYNKYHLLVLIRTIYNEILTKILYV
jgi:hypothetical protein